MNSIIIKGRLTADPELKYTQSGTPVCSVGVAVNRQFSKDEEVDFFNVVFWRQTAEFVSKYFTKGQEILIIGEMQSRKYTDRDGNDRIAWELKADRVEFCGSKTQDDSAGTKSTEQKATKKPTNKKAAAAPVDVDVADEDDDGDLPF